MFNIVGGETLKPSQIDDSKIDAEHTNNYNTTLPMFLSYGKLVGEKLNGKLIGLPPTFAKKININKVLRWNVYLCCVHT